MKPSTLALSAAVLALAALAAYEATVISAQKEQLAALTDAGAKERSVSVLFERRQRCADQAQKVFSRSGWKPTDMAGFENHYSAKLDKCFIAVFGSLSGDSHSRTIMDAFEGKEYGTYIWTNPTGKPAQDVAPMRCSVVTPSGETLKCRSDDEFTTMVKVYMEG